MITVTGQKRVVQIKYGQSHFFPPPGRLALPFHAHKEGTAWLITEDKLFLKHNLIVLVVLKKNFISFKRIELLNSLIFWKNW